MTPRDAITKITFFINILKNIHATIIKVICNPGFSWSRNQIKPFLTFCDKYLLQNVNLVVPKYICCRCPMDSIQDPCMIFNENVPFLVQSSSQGSPEEMWLGCKKYNRGEQILYAN